MENNINTKINELEKRPEEKKKWRTPELKKISIEDATDMNSDTGDDGTLFS